MKKYNDLPTIICAVIIVLAVMYHSPALGADIVSVQSIDIKPYNEAYEGFRSICACEAEQIVMSDLPRNRLIQKIRSLEPALILAVGLSALRELKEITEIPIVYLMVLDPGPLIAGRTNITGVDIYIPPDKQLFHIQNIIPHISKIGIIYDPDLNGEFVKKAVSAADAFDIGLVTKKISDPRDFPVLLREMQDDINAFWMLPDLTAFTPETTEYLFLASISHNMPVITFSERYLDMGALISFNIDAFDMGRQAYGVSEKILNGAKINREMKTFARKANIAVNQTTAKKLGIFNINDKLIKAIAINLE